VFEDLADTHIAFIALREGAEVQQRRKLADTLFNLGRVGAEFADHEHVVVQKFVH